MIFRMIQTTISQSLVKPPHGFALLWQDAGGMKPFETQIRSNLCEERFVRRSKSYER
jgi:hypothetical protein